MLPRQLVSSETHANAERAHASSMQLEEVASQMGAIAKHVDNEISVS